MSLAQTHALILAGGQGTRLRALWNSAKCLVPVGGVPLVERLVLMLKALEIERIFLSLGHRHDAVLSWLATLPRSDISAIIEDRPLGTAGALRHAVLSSAMEIGTRPLLVLNGDTLPLYDLGGLVRFHTARHGAWASVAMAPRAAEWREVYAGAAVLSPRAIDEICADERTSDLSAHLLGALRYSVPGFLDVGTPEGFQRAQEWRG